MTIEPEEGTPIIVSAQTDRACDAYIRMLDLEKQREEANASALDVFTRDTLEIMHRAIFIEWTRWGWKGSAEMSVIQQIMKANAHTKMDFMAARLVARAQYQKTKLPAYGYVAAAAVTKMLTSAIKVGDVAIAPRDLWSHVQTNFSLAPRLGGAMKRPSGHEG